MGLILNIESSGQMCSVALASEGKVISLKEYHDGKSHAVKLAPFIDELLKENNTVASGLDAVAVSKGPGSYTGLRIGVSTAKGIAYAFDKPLIAINTLTSMSSGFLTEYPEYSGEDMVLCPMIDARRMEVYTCLFNTSLEKLSDVSAEIITRESFSHILINRKVVFFGNGAEKCRETLPHPNAIFVNGFEPSARFMVELSFKKYVENSFENTAYFEPFYLKDFVATVPRKKLI